MKPQATPLHCTLTIWIITVITVIAVMLTTPAVSGEESEQQVETPVVGKLVKTAVVGAIPQGDRPSLPARVKATEQVDLAFNVSGRLIELPVEEGQMVAKGALLARIDSRDFQNTLAVRQAVFNKVKNQYERYGRLIKSKRAPISRAEYDQKKSEYEVAEAQLTQAKKDLSDTYLRAPFDGVVAARYVDNFENVEGKELILRLEDISRIDILLDVPERDVVQVECLTVADCEHNIGVVTFESTPERVFQATVKEYATKADPNTQTYELTLTLPRPEDVNVLPGMTATVVQMRRSAEAETTFVVPNTAVAQAETGAFYAWLVDMDTLTVSKREVTVGDKTEEAIQVLAGLNPGDRIVAAGVPLLTEGMKVRLFRPGMWGT